MKSMKCETLSIFFIGHPITDSNMNYSFRYSRPVIIISTLGLVALVALIYHLIGSKSSSVYDYIGWAGALGLLYPILSMPISLSDDGDTLTLRRLIWTKQYRRAEYSIENVDKINLQGSLRLFGSGGYFGFLGLFWSPTLGVFNLIQTESSSYFIKIRKKRSSRFTYIAYN